MKEIILGMTVKEIVGVFLDIIVVLSIIVEFINKIPFKPISKVLSWLGELLIKNQMTPLVSELKEIKKETKANSDAIIDLENKVEKRFSEHQKEADEKEAKRLRSSIICFADSCRLHDKHTKAHFDNVFRDYDDYLAYCSKHDLENHFIDSEIDYIKSVYLDCQKQNNFL